MVTQILYGVIIGSMALFVPLSGMEQEEKWDSFESSGEQDALSLIPYEGDDNDTVPAAAAETTQTKEPLNVAILTEKLHDIKHKQEHPFNLLDHWDFLETILLKNMQGKHPVKRMITNLRYGPGSKPQHISTASVRNTEQLNTYKTTVEASIAKAIGTSPHGVPYLASVETKCEFKDSLIRGLFAKPRTKEVLTSKEGLTMMDSIDDEEEILPPEIA